MRAAVPADEPRLRELTFESKAHWGYDIDLVRGWANGLTFPDDCERWLAEANGELLGWAGLRPPADNVAVLDHLWVDPGCFGRGIGTRLFRHAADRARELGAERMEWSAEVNSVGFYETMGGRKLHDHITDWGRAAPWMGLEL